METQGPSRLLRTPLKDILKKPYDWIVRCDQFGHFSRTDPSRFPRTLTGGALSLIFFALAAATIGISIVLHYGGEPMAYPTNHVPSWSSIAIDPVSGKLVTLDPSIIIPSLKLDFRLRFLEFGGAGIIQVRPSAVIDQTLKFPGLILAADSNVTDDVAAASRSSRGTLLSDRVPIGTVDMSTRVLPDASAPPSYVRDLHSSMAMAALHPDESSDVSYVLKAPFFPHVATLVVALPRYQLEAISPRQLQLSLVNNGQFLHMSHAGNRPALAPAPSHLAIKIIDIFPRVPTRFRSKGVSELFSLQIEMSAARMQAFAAAQGLSVSEASSSEFNNYRFSVNYLSRSNFSYQNYSCPTEPQFSVQYAKLLSPILRSSDRIHVPMSYTYPSPPFQIVLSSERFHFIARVISIKSSSIFSNALELGFPNSFGPFVLGSSEMLGRTSWTCDLDHYNDSRVCDCGCSSYDPDCDGPTNPVYGCNDGFMCSGDGRCVTSDDVYASSACEDVKIPGSHYTSGRVYIGATETSTSFPVCPNDMLFHQNAQWNHMTRSFQCGSPISASISPFQNKLALESLMAATVSNTTSTATVSAIITDKRAPFPEGVFNPPLLVNRMVSGSVHSTFKLHSVARVGALEPVPDSSSALPYAFGPDITSPSAWFPATAARPVKVVHVEGLGCYEAWQNTTVYMEQGNYNSLGQYIPGCPECGRNLDTSTGRCSLPGDLSCRAPSQGGGFNYRCVAHRTDNTLAVTYGSATPFYGVWQGYCEQLVGYSVELEESECSSNPCKQDFMINYNGTHVNYFSGAFTPGSKCDDIQRIRQRMEISGSLPVTAAWVLTAASSNSEFITLFARDVSQLFPIFGFKDDNNSSLLRVGHVSIELSSASSAISAENVSSASAFQSSIPGYFQVLRLKRNLAPSVMAPQPGSFAFISAQALVISSNFSGELNVHGENGIWDLLNRQSSRSKCASSSSSTSKLVLLNSSHLIASVFVDDGVVVRRLVEVEPAKLLLDFPLPSFVSLPVLIYITLDDSALHCSSAIGSHILDVVLPPQHASDAPDETLKALDIQAIMLVQDLVDVQSSSAVHSDDMPGFCPNTAQSIKTIDGRVVLPPNVTNRRGLAMSECVRQEFGREHCFLSQPVNDSKTSCQRALESPSAELHLGASLGINNNALVNASNLEYLSPIASLRDPDDVDVLFKFRMPVFPGSVKTDEAADSGSAADDSNFLVFHAASVIRGGVISDMHSVPSNLTQLPARDPLFFPHMTIALADYAQDDVLALQSASKASNSEWPGTPEGVVKLLSSFPSFTFDWNSALEELASNISGGLRVKAGTSLTLNAFVSVVANFEVDSIGIRKLIGWETSVIKTSAFVHQLPPNQRDEFRVRFSVRIHNLSPSVEKKAEVSLRQIAIAVGGASFGYILLGLFLLRIIQQIGYAMTNVVACGVFILVGRLCDHVIITRVHLAFQSFWGIFGTLSHALTQCQHHQVYLTGKGGNLVEFKGVGRGLQPAAT